MNHYLYNTRITDHYPDTDEEEIRWMYQISSLTINLNQKTKTFTPYNSAC
jgi:hypothetical protein